MCALAIYLRAGILTTADFENQNVYYSSFSSYIYKTFSSHDAELSYKCATVMLVIKRKCTRTLLISTVYLSE